MNELEKKTVDLFRSCRVDLNGDGYVDKDEFNQVIKEKNDSLDERKISFFKKILTKENGDRVSYQGKNIQQQI